MDQHEMQLYAKFGFAMRRAGLPVDLMQFVNDDQYAEKAIAQALQSTDADLLRLGMEAGVARKLINGSRKSVAGIPLSTGPETPDPNAPKKKKFIKSLR